MTLFKADNPDGSQTIVVLENVTDYVVHSGVGKVDIWTGYANGGDPPALWFDGEKATRFVAAMEALAEQTARLDRALMMLLNPVLVVEGDRVAMGADGYPIARLEDVGDKGY